MTDGKSRSSQGQVKPKIGPGGSLRLACIGATLAAHAPRRARRADWAVGAFGYGILPSCAWVKRQNSLVNELTKLFCPHAPG